MYTVEVLERLKYIANQPRPMCEVICDPPRIVSKTGAYAKRFEQGDVPIDELVDEATLLQMLQKTEKYSHVLDIIDGRIPPPDYEEEIVDLIPGTDIFKYPKSLADACLDLMRLYLEEHNDSLVKDELSVREPR